VDSTAYGINNSDWIVGRSNSDTGSQGFLWRSGTMTSLQGLLNDPNASHWQIFDAQGINSSGQIVGTGYYDGQLRAYVMTPLTTPEPWSFAPLLLGLVVLARRRRR
jgi:MYXO-CTERM domain-containing protein